jgi:carboxyl-terminal processing protease
MKTASQVLLTVLAAGTICFYSGCRKSDSHPDYPAGTQENINSWILDSMKVYYYWNTALPRKPNLSQDPSSFFKAIKYGGDRFSALVNPDIASSYPSSLVHTLGFDLITLQNGDGTVQTVVSLVVPGSRAEARGLTRGDVVQTINGQVPTASNIAALSQTIINAGTAEISVVGKVGVLSISRLTSSEDPLYIYKVFTSGGRNYGYLFLNSFEAAALSRLITAFSYFRQQQVDELIIDMRYNPGGSVPVAAALASMLAPNAAASNIFVQYRGNSNAGTRQSSFAAELNQLPAEVRKTFAQLITYRLTLNKVYLLSGSHTASAAELLINSLRPYMNVVQLGKQTLGKDMASFVIKDYRNPQVVAKWEIYPMIFKLYNAAGSGEYSGGLVPDVIADELTVLPLVPFGDVSDPLVQRCLNPAAAITARTRVESTAKTPAILFDSRDQVDDNSTGLSIKRF